MRHWIAVFGVVAMALPGFGQTDDVHPGPKDSKVVAIVLGKRIPTTETHELTGVILGILLEQFATENSIEPTS